jgi:hypothetical protein
MELRQSESCTWSSINRTLLLQSAHIARESHDYHLASACMSTFLQIIGQQERQYSRQLLNWNMLCDRLRKGEVAVSQIPVIPSSLPIPPENPSLSRKLSMSQADTLPLSEESVRSHQLNQNSMRHDSFSTKHPLSVSAQSAHGMQSGLSSASIHGVSSSVFPPFRSRSNITLSVMDTNSVHSVGGDLVDGLPGSRRPFKPIFAPSQPSTSDNNPSGLLSTESIVSTIRSANEGISSELINAKETIKLGLRNIAVPNITPSLISFVHGGVDHPSSSKNGSSKKPLQLNRSNHSRVNKRSPIRLHRKADLSINSNSIRQNSGKADQVSVYADIIAAVQLCLERYAIPREHQIQAWNLLQNLSRLMKPFASMSLPVVIVNVKPKLLPLFQRPILLTSSSTMKADEILDSLQSQQMNSEEKVNGANTTAEAKSDVVAKKSSLFYDPFAAKRTSDVDSLASNMAVWSVAYPGRVVIQLANPYLIPIAVDHISLQIDGAEHLTNLCGAVEIPPRCDAYPIEIAVLPCEEGELIIRGVIVIINNIKCYYPVEKDGQIAGSTSYPSSRAGSSLIANTMIAVTKPAVSYEVSTSAGAGAPAELCENIPLDLYKGEIRREKISLSRRKDLNAVDEQLLDIKVSAVWWITRQSTTTSSTVLSKINPVIRKKKILKDFDSTIISSSSVGDNDPCPVYDLQVMENGGSKDVEISWCLDKDYGNQRLQIEIEILSSAEKPVIEMIKRLLSDTGSSELLSMKYALSINARRLHSRVYSLSYMVNRLQSAVEMIQVETLSPQRISTSDPCQSSIDRQLLNGLTSLLQHQRSSPSIESSSSNPLAICMLPERTSSFVKIANRTPLPIRLKLMSEREDSIDVHLAGRSSHVWKCSSSSASVEWLIDEELASSVADYNTRQGIATMDLTNPSKSGAKASAIDRMEIWSKQHDQPAVLVSGDIINTTARLSLSILIKFYFHEKLESRSDMQVLRLAIVLLEEIDEPLVDMIEASSSVSQNSMIIPKHLVVNGSLMKSISIPSDAYQISTYELQHQISIYPLKAGRWKILPCYQLISSSSFNSAAAAVDEPLSQWYTRLSAIRIHVRS